MNRRRFLAAGIAAAPSLAGCLSLAPGGSSLGPTVAITDRDGPPDVPLRPGVEIVEPSATDARPPELRATVENTADHIVEVGEERDIVFAFVHSVARPGLVLLPRASDYVPVEAGCWRLTEAVSVAAYYGAVILTPGGLAERRLGVWATHDAEGCLPNGEFRFESRFEGGPDRTDDIDDPAWEAEWGFTLTIE